MKVLVLGDSHAVYFGMNEELKSISEDFRGNNTTVLAKPGSTIQGLGRRKSTLNLREDLIKNISEKEYDGFCFALGQVDIELGIYYKEIIKGEKFNRKEHIINLAHEYVTTIRNLSNELNIDNNKICIKGINISVLTKHREKAIKYTSKIISENIDDKLEKEDYLKKLKDSFPSNIERYNMHILFNQTVNDICGNEFSYFDINDILEDKKNKYHCNEFFIPYGMDHHITDSLYIRKLILTRLFNSISTKNFSIKE